MSQGYSNRPLGRWARPGERTLPPGPPALQRLPLATSAGRCGLALSLSALVTVQQRNCLPLQGTGMSVFALLELSIPQGLKARREGLGPQGE